MQPFAKNMAVEYAAKALPDSELAQSLKDLKEGKTTIEEVTALIEGGTVSNAKPIYWHTIRIQRGGTSVASNVSRVFGYFVILNNTSNLFTIAEFKNMLRAPGVNIVLIGGLYSASGGVDLSGMIEARRLVYKNTNVFDVAYISNTDNQEAIGGDLTIDTGWTAFEDLGANKIN